MKFHLLVLLLLLAACSPEAETTTRVPVDPTIGPTSTTVATGGDAADTQTIAEESVAEHSLVLVALMEENGEAPTATVVLRAFSSGDEQPLGEVVIDEPGSFFWHPVTGEGGVCQFFAEPGEGRVSLVVTVQLLLSPSLGCSPVHIFEIREGTLVPAG